MLSIHKNGVEPAKNRSKRERRQISFDLGLNLRGHNPLIWLELLGEKIHYLLETTSWKLKNSTKDKTSFNRP